MKTILDTGHTWFLDRLFYEPADAALNVEVLEGARVSAAHDLTIGEHKIENVYDLGTTPTSRRVRIRFLGLIAWQCVDESYTAGNDEETFETKGYLCVLTSSRYMKYVEQAHGCYADLVGPAKHYRLWTENEVLDIVATEAPAVVLI